MYQQIRQGLLVSLPALIVDELLEAYKEVKTRFYLNDFRPNAVEGGRFTEAVFRILEYRVYNKYTPLGKRIRTDDLIGKFAQIPSTDQPPSIRLHIPRTLRVIYDIRNGRDAAHLGDGIDPNIQDASLVIANCDWVMAELVRLYHSVTPAQAQNMIEDLVERKIPSVQNFNGFLKTLNPSWGPKERILVTLCQRSNQGAEKRELCHWLKPEQRPNINRVLRQLEYGMDFIHRQDEKYFITHSGRANTETNLLQGN